MSSVNDSYEKATGSRILAMTGGEAEAAPLLLAQRLNSLYEREAKAGRPRTNNAIAEQLRERNPGCGSPAATSPRSATVGAPTPRSNCSARSPRTSRSPSTI